MKKIAIFTLLTIMGWANAQHTEIKYIPTISTDTITTKARLYPNILSRNKFNPMVFENGLKVGERRQEVTLRSKDIFYIEFVDKDMNTRVFRQVPELNLAGKLFEVMATGKVSWYRTYFSYKSDAWDSSYAYDDYFIKYGKITKVPVKGKYKKKLRALLAEKPELVIEVDRIINDTDIKEILEKYNKN